MTFDKWKLKDFLTIDEVARRLSEESKDDTKVSWSDVLSLALDGHLPLVVKIPPLTFVYPQEAPKDGRRPTIEGIWSLVMEGQRGSSARRSIDRSYRRLADLQPANDEGIGGVWVERDGEQWQLDPYGRQPKEVLENPVALHALTSQDPSVPRGCILGARTGAVEKLLTQEISSYKKPVEAEWRDVTFRFLSEHTVQIKVHEKVLPSTSYAELGFEDKRKGQPNAAWETLVKLAESEDHCLLLPAWKSKGRAKLDSVVVEAWKTETGDSARRMIQNQANAINKTLRAALKNRGYEIPKKPEPLQTDVSKAAAFKAASKKEVTGEPPRESKPTRMEATYYAPNFRIEWANPYN